MQSAAFADIVAAYEQAVSGRIMIRGERPLKTASLKQLDNDIDKAAARVKIYTTAKYERGNCTDIYPVFGLVKDGGAYRLPRDRQKRLAALNLMITGIDSEGFGSKPYGTAFWTDMRDQYATALSAATGSAMTVSTTARDKNALKAQILKVMKALQKALEANYPDTYKQAWRAWGWLKEHY
jgi:hypothetical protein